MFVFYIIFSQISILTPSCLNTLAFVICQIIIYTDPPIARIFSVSPIVFPQSGFLWS